MAEVRLTPGGTPQTVLPDLPSRRRGGVGLGRRRSPQVGAGGGRPPGVAGSVGRFGTALRIGGEHFGRSRGVLRLLPDRLPPGSRHPETERLAGVGIRSLVASLQPRIPGQSGRIEANGEAVGEEAESVRCADFLAMLDPSYRT